MEKTAENLTFTETKVTLLFNFRSAKV